VNARPDEADVVVLAATSAGLTALDVAVSDVAVSDGADTAALDDPETVDAESPADVDVLVEGVGGQSVRGARGVRVDVVDVMVVSGAVDSVVVDSVVVEPAVVDSVVVEPVAGALLEVVVEDGVPTVNAAVA
jgi:hypothetical protein